MKITLQGIVGAAALFLAAMARGQFSIPPDQSPLTPSELPKFGNFYFLVGPSPRFSYPPLPGPPGDGSPIYALGDGNFVIDNRDVSSGGATMGAASSMGAFQGMEDPGSFSGSGSSQGPCPGFVQQVFSLLHTNATASSDTNLYDELLLFPTDTNAGPDLQIMLYHKNVILIKANHFDYSAETRDFALVICDSIALPLCKTIDLSQTTNVQDGWLVQGTIPNWKVTDPMYLMVSNVSLSCDAFFQAIPYSGPEIELAGPQPYDTVSNTISLHAAISDLSGVANEQFYMTLGGYPLRYTLGTSNTITIDTRYYNAGLENVYANAFNTARIYDPANPPDKAKLSFSTSALLPLDFENATYLAFASDMCSPDVGTNYFLFVINTAQNVSATITDPSNGHAVASYSGYVSNPGTVEIPWNFTEADGVTPYSNNTYVVTFVASDPVTLTVTNTIDRAGVRIGAGTFMTYQWEDPGDPTGEGLWLDNQADTYIKADLAYLYEDLYDQYGLTQYYSYMVGANRNIGDCYPRDSYSIDWPHILVHLTNTIYSELTLGPAHGSGSEIGGGEGDFLPGTFSPADLKNYVLGVYNQNWRLRKADLWTCYSGNVYLATGGFYNTTWADACGIRPKGLQENTYMRKNCGLFLGGEINQRGFSGGNASISTSEVVEACDQVWVCGKNEYPGGCDPTYSFGFAVNATRGMFNPELDQANPLLWGYEYMIYSDVYDDLLMVLNNSFVQTQ